MAGGGDWESVALQGVNVAEWNGDPAALGFSSFTHGLNVGTYQNIVPSECADSDIGEEDLIDPAMGKMGVDWEQLEAEMHELTMTELAIANDGKEAFLAPQQSQMDGRKYRGARKSHS